MANKIMIVDENKEFLTALQEILTLSGYSIIAINDSTIALQVAKTRKPDVILIDIKMKGIYKFQAVKSLKRSLRTTHIPIIAMSTSIPRKKDNMLLTLWGIEICLHKPFNPLDVITAIENILRKSWISSNRKEKYQYLGKNIKFKHSVKIDLNLKENFKKFIA